ncbi:DUF3889 domain-containing protein [Paenibacillus sp. sgz302251]|uniref:DUF3889 domain-containing protein n=1 Tax=Paenibacillus sp. sgz302251 TaxID=3414493 RepID=UPI003C7CA325
MLRHFVMKAVFVLLSLTHFEEQPFEAVYQHAEPAYAKWGRLAMEQTSRMYSDASIVDYKYEGRKKLSEEASEESFVLWLRKDTREFGIRVSIQVKTSSDELIAVSIKELNAR